MQNLIDSLERFISIDEDKLWVDTIRKLESLIVALNTQGQLFKGINSENIELKRIGGEYADFTKMVKSRRGQPNDRVTLLDTGLFYDSFKVLEDSNGFTITADFFKGTFDLRFRWGDKLAGLTHESRKIVMQAIIKEYKKQILKTWTGT